MNSKQAAAILGGAAGKATQGWKPGKKTQTAPAFPAPSFPAAGATTAGAAAGAKAAPAGVPAPPAAGPTPMPYTASYFAAVNALQNNLSNQLAGINYEEGRVKQDFGFDDLSNPFSRAKLLEQNYKNAVRGTTTRMASQGQLYAGSTQNAQNFNARSRLHQEDTLRRAYDDALASLNARRRDAELSAKSGAAQALAALMDNPPPAPEFGDAPAQAPKEAQLSDFAGNKAVEAYLKALQRKAQKKGAAKVGGAAAP